MDGPQILLSAAHRRSTQPIHGRQMLPRLLPEKSLHHDDDKQSVHDNTHMMMVMRMTIFRLMNDDGDEDDDIQTHECGLRNQDYDL